MKNFYYYTASAIEGNKDKGLANWQKDLLAELDYPNWQAYIPALCEANKTGTSCQETNDYIHGLKRAGHYDRFNQKLDEVWWGDVSPRGDKFEILKHYRRKATLNEISPEEFVRLGDFPAVASSDFIIAYFQKNVPSFGAPAEVTTAYFLDIPIYLIIPDQSKTDCNSTKLHFVRRSGGEIFYTVKDCIKFIKSRYNLD